MKNLKRALSILLSLMIVLGAAAVGLCVPVSAVGVGDIIQFGSYPQSWVEETTALKNAAGGATWKSYGYYIGTGDYDGQMVQSDYMQYKDFVSDGIKYRAVKFTQYRPKLTKATSSAYNSNQDDNYFELNETYYFKYEPLEWRVLDPTYGLVLCENVIDSQAYQNIVRKNGSAYYIGSTSTYANNYVESSIRKWLNNDFYNTAFNTAQKNKIISTAINNDAFSDEFSQYNVASTTDPVFLLSFSEAENSSYGFYDNGSRMGYGTDYAKCQGLWVNDTYGSSNWWLRSAGYDSLYASIADKGGYAHGDYCISDIGVGVRPACYLINLSSEVYYSVTATASPAAGGTVSGGGAYTEGQTATLTATANSGYLFSGWYKDGSKVSSSKSYSFTVTESVTLTAKFGKLSFGNAVNANAEPAEGGTVSGDGSYSDGQLATLTATANTGWHFIGWYNGSEKVSSNASFSFTVTKDVDLTAKFEKDANAPYTVKLFADPAEGGTVSGGGAFSEGQFAYITATPNSGWHFDGWYKGGNKFTVKAFYSFTVTESVALTARFEKDTPNKPDFSGFNIKEFNSTLPVDYKSTVIFHTTIDAPEGYEIVWSNGTKGSECKLSSVTNKEYKISAKMVNKTTGGTEAVTEEVTVSVNTGFLAKIIAFFRNLFGSLPAYEDFKKK